MVRLPGWRIPGNAQVRIRNVAPMNEGAHRMPTTMQLQFLPGFYEKNRARNDAIKLLSRAVNVGGAGEDDGKLVILEKSQQVQVARGARRRVGSAGIERGGFGHIAAATAVNLRRRDMDVFLEKCQFPELFMKPDIGHHV